MNKSMLRFSALLRREATQILRDRITLIFFIGLPLIELFLFAYAVSLTVYHLPTAIVDQSNDAQSRAFINTLTNSQYFDITETLQSSNQVVQAIDAGTVKAGVVIPPDFSADLQRGDANVLILLDGSDSFSVESGYAAASTITQQYSLNMITQSVSKMGTSSSIGATLKANPIVTAIRVLYNPDLKDLWFILPGIVGMIMQSLAIAQAALMIVKEREIGTMEQILATPTRPFELILAKMIPLLVICLAITGIILIFGVFWFGVPFVGSLLLYFVMSLIFMGTSLAIGLLISTVAHTQREALQIGMVIMLFSMLLTGIVYPRNAMPLVPTWIGNFIPLTYFIRISREIITKGVGFAYVWQDGLILLVYGIVVMAIASLSFKKRLD